MDLSRASLSQSAASCSRSLLTLPLIRVVEEYFDPRSEIESRTRTRVPGRVFSFYFDFEDAAASFSFGHLYALSMDASRALCAAVCLRWPGVCRSRSWAVTLGRAGGAKPVPSGMDWLGACPGGGTT